MQARAHSFLRRHTRHTASFFDARCPCVCPCLQANNIMVVYPQTRGLLCWDWTGAYVPPEYETDWYDTRRSPQMLAVNRMVDAVLHGEMLPLAPCLESTCKAEYQKQPFRTGNANDISQL